MKKFALMVIISTGILGLSACEYSGPKMKWTDGTEMRFVKQKGEQLKFISKLNVENGKVIAMEDMSLFKGSSIWKKQDGGCVVLKTNVEFVSDVKQVINGKEYQVKIPKITRENKEVSCDLDL